MTRFGDRKYRRERLSRDRDILGRCGWPLRRREGTCPMVAGDGTFHFGHGPCKSHGDRELHEGWVAAMDVAREYDITPWEALLKNVRLAAGRVGWVDEQLSEAVRKNDGDMNKPEIARWLKESRLERTLMAKMAKAAIDGGVAERLVRQTELEGQLVAAAVIAALDRLDFLTTEQRTAALDAAHQKLLSGDDDQSVTIHDHGTRLHDDGPHRTDPDSRPSANSDTDWIPPDPEFGGDEEGGDQSTSD
jgi:hypothetical protein